MSNKVFTKEEIKDAMLSLYYDDKPSGFGVGLSNLDELVIWETGRLSIITGIPNHGKSEFVDFLSVQFNKLYGWKTLFFSPENYPIKKHLNKIGKKIVNKKIDKDNLNEIEIMKIFDFINENFFFLNKDNVNNIDDILACTKELINKEDIRVLVIDAFYNLEHMKPNNILATDYIDIILNTLQTFAQKNDILIQLIAHPRKIQMSNGIYNVPNFYEISGSANFPNRADYSLTVYRDMIENITQIHVQKVRFDGCQGVAYLKYDHVSGNFFDVKKEIYDPLSFINPADFEKEKEKTVQEIYREQVEKWKNKNVLNVYVTLYNHLFDKVGKDINLYSYLKNGLNEMSFDYSNYKKFKDKEMYRNMFEYIIKGDTDPNNYLKWIRTQDNYKDIKTLLPFTTTSGTFKDGHKNDNLIKHNNLIGIDIDLKDNTTDMNIIYNRLKRLKYIAYIGHSASGKGIYCIIPILDSDKHLEHFLSIENEFKEMGIKIDTTCKDVSRIRFYCYDPNAYFNEKATTYTLLYTPPIEEKTDKQENKIKQNKQNNNANTHINIDNKQLKNAINDIQDNHIDITKPYENWRNLAFIFYNEFGEEGRQLFHIISGNHPEYDKERTNEEYDKAKKYDYKDLHLNTFYHLYYEAKNKNKDLN